MRRIAVIAAVACLLAPAAARAGADPQVAGLQVALRAHGLYLASIDGLEGPRTDAALHAFEQSRRLPVGPATPRIRRALGPLGSPRFGARTMHRGDFGLDVAALQFLLTKRGVYNGALDGFFGAQTASALARYQRRLRLSADAVAGPRTLAAIRRGRTAPARAGTARARMVNVSYTTSASYTVRSGDSLTAIAAAHGTTIGAITSLNGIDAARPIVIGQHLRLPGATAARPALASQSGTVPTLLDEWADRLGVDPQLVRALAWMESGFQTSIVSPAGAVGVLQTLPTTRTYVETVLNGAPIPHTVDGDVEVGVLYLKHLLGAFDGNVQLALAGWYQGERAVREHGVYAVSKPFVADVLALRGRV